MSGTHARIAISSLALTVACPGSVTLQESVPEAPDTPEEAEGTAAHVPARYAADGNMFELATFNSGGKTWNVDTDMANGARLYAQALGGPHSMLRTEDTVRASTIHPTDCWGTPDAWRYFAPGEHTPLTIDGMNWPVEPGAVLRVGDYKYGHRFVDSFENYQLMGYAVAVMERLGLLDINLMLELIVVQPRCYVAESRVRVWRVRAVDIRAFINIAFNAAHDALGPNPRTQTGMHCGDCRARHVCKTFQRAVANIVDFSGTAELWPLDATAMGQELRVLDAALKRLEARRTGLAATVEATLRAGQAVPFYEMQPTRSSLAWDSTLTPQSLAAVGDLLGVDIRKPLAVMTPRQAIDSGIDETVISQYASRPPGAMVLKPSSTTQIRKAFGAAHT